MRRAILERFRAEHGDRPIALLPQQFIALTLSKMRPFAARNWLKAIRHLMQFAVSVGLRKDDPTQGIKLRSVKTDGIYTWSEQNIEVFEAAYPVGTKARLAFALLLYTAQRRSDIIRMGRQHISNGVLHVRQQKTGATLSIPVHPDLQAIIDATSTDHLTFLTTKTVSRTPATISANNSARGAMLPNCRGLLRAWIAQGRVPAISRSWMQRERNRRYFRPCHVERATALHQGRGPTPNGP